MGFHTDQSLDLADDSYICLFSCYNNPSTKDIRKLKIKNKTNNICSEVLLKHNSIVLFSLVTNHEHVHKIVLEENTENNLWLGITFRLSKTFVKFTDNIPYLYPDNIILRLANDIEKKEFIKHKGIENIKNNYIYPKIDYTIGISDLMNI